MPDRGSRDEHHLAAVGVDVGLPERDAVARRGLLGRADQRIDRVGGCISAVFGEVVVDPAELHERHRNVPVLAVTVAGEQMVARHGRQAAREVGVGARAADRVVLRRAG